MPHWVLAVVVFLSALLVALQFSGRILDWVRFQSIGTRDYIADKLQLMMIDIPPERILLYQVSLSFGLGSLIFLLCLPNFAVGGFFWSGHADRGLGASETDCELPLQSTGQ